MELQKLNIMSLISREIKDNTIATDKGSTVFSEMLNGFSGLKISDKPQTILQINEKEIEEFVETLGDISNMLGLSINQLLSKIEENTLNVSDASLSLKQKQFVGEISECIQKIQVKGVTGYKSEVKAINQLTVHSESQVNRLLKQKLIDADSKANIEVAVQSIQQAMQVLMPKVVGTDTKANVEVAVQSIQQAMQVLMPKIADTDAKANVEVAMQNLRQAVQVLMPKIADTDAKANVEVAKQNLRQAVEVLMPKVVNTNTKANVEVAVQSIRQAEQVLMPKVVETDTNANIEVAMQSIRQAVQVLMPKVAETDTKAVEVAVQNIRTNHSLIPKVILRGEESNVETSIKTEVKQILLDINNIIHAKVAESNVLEKAILPDAELFISNNPVLELLSKKHVDLRKDNNKIKEISLVENKINNVDAIGIKNSTKNVETVSEAKKIIQLFGEFKKIQTGIKNLQFTGLHSVMHSRLNPQIASVNAFKIDDADIKLNANGKLINLSNSTNDAGKVNLSTDSKDNIRKEFTLNDTLQPINLESSFNLQRSVNVQDTVNKTSNVIFEDLQNNIIDKFKIIIKENKKEMVLALTPENLGKINLRVISEAGKVSAHIQVDNAQVKEMLNVHIGTLKENLKDQGINISSVDIEYSGSLGNRNFSSQHQSGNHRQNLWEQKMSPNYHNTNLKEEEQKIIKMSNSNNMQVARHEYLA